jgi:hypothetical protein
MYTVGLLDSGAVNLFVSRLPSFWSDVRLFPSGKKLPRNLEATTEGVSVSTGNDQRGARACLTNYAQNASPVREIARIFCPEF